jgi:hypothetical protein
MRRLILIAFAASLILSGKKDLGTAQSRIQVPENAIRTAIQAHLAQM